jgi:hypothetical protein
LSGPLLNNASQAIAVPACLQGTALQRLRYLCKHGKTEDNMPILLWLLGVPLSLIVVLMLFGAF